MILGVVDRARNAWRARARSALRAARPDGVLVAIADTLQGGAALEPGGPSPVFREGALVPVYPRLAALDTLDYSERTLWSDSQHAGEIRNRLIGEARWLDGVEDGAYDALLASHVIEHLANPLGALAEWQRVVRPGGHVLLVVPHYEGTFDHRRPVTTVEHLKSDAARDTGEDDMTHVEEILALHDLKRDPGAPNREVFEQRCRENPSSRAMHHHVFDSRAVFDACTAAGLEVIALRPKRLFDIVCLCRVQGGDGSSDSDRLDERALAEVLAASPFATDRAVAAGRA